jgi:putative ABC transport system substrate-binding protein
MIKRREFITAVGSAAVTWPLAAHARQPAMPVVGVLHSQSPDAFREQLRGFRQGLKEAGYVEGENVAIEYRFADNQMDQLPELAANLVRRRVAVIVTAGGPAPAFAAKSATATIPIVFTTGDDPVRLGLVASLARPDRNLTSVSFLVTLLSAKRFEFLRALAPGAVRVAALVNPAEAANTEITLRDMEEAARILGLHLQVFKADTGGEINVAFASIVRERLDALFVAATAFFVARRVQLTQLAAFHRLPAAYPIRDFAEVGGLMSYGTSAPDAYRQVGVYVGRILKGAKPADLPVVQSSKLELIINRQTAGMLGLTVPDNLLATADEVIE